MDTIWTITSWMTTIFQLIGLGMIVLFFMKEVIEDDYFEEHEFVQRVYDLIFGFGDEGL